MTIIERQKLIDARRRRLLRPQVMDAAIGLGRCDGEGCGQITFVADLTLLRRESDPPATKLCTTCLEARHTARERRQVPRDLPSPEPSPLALSLAWNWDRTSPMSLADVTEAAMARIAGER